MEPDLRGAIAAGRPSGVRRAIAAAVVLGLALAACGSDEETANQPATTTDPTSMSTSTTTRATTTAEATSTTAADPVWVVGAAALPLRPDGLGEILPTPEPLRERGLPSTDLLPPPSDDGYRATIEPLRSDTIARMGRTWTDGCPVGLDELRRVELTFWGFDAVHHTGELIVHRDVAEDVAWVFGRLHEARFPLEQVAIVTPADLDAPPTGDGNTTAAFVCRSVRGGSTPSAHASGLAVDVNPFTNPYVRGDAVIPELASAYLDREWRRPGMIYAGDVVAESFAAIGWTWAGTWSSPDYMHFSATGR